MLDELKILQRRRTTKWLASLDQQGKLIRWDIERKQLQWESRVIVGTDCLAISPDGKLLVTHQVVTDSNDGRELFRFGKPPNELEANEVAAFSSDGKVLASIWGSAVTLIETQNWRVLERQQDGNAPLIAIHFSPDNAKLVTGSTDGTLLLWDTKPLRKIGLLGRHAGRLGSVSFSSDGRLAASAGSDKTIKLWDVNARKWLRDIGTHAAPVAAVAFTPDGGRLISGEQDRSVRVYTRHRELWGRRVD